MPPLQQTQKEKRQGCRANPYRRPRCSSFDLFAGSQFEWAQAQQIHSDTVNTIVSEWQNTTSNEFGDNTNDYDDNEKPSLKQVNDTKELVVMLASLENPSRKNSDINTKRGATMVEQNGVMVQPPERKETVESSISHATNNNGQFNSITNNNNQFNNSIIANNNNQFNNTITNHNGQFGTSTITNNSQFGSFVANKSNQVSNSIINSSNNNRNNIFSKSNGHSNVITSNNDRISAVSNSNIHNSVINNSNGRNSVVSNSNGHGSFITNNNIRSNAFTNNNTRSNVIASDNVRSNAITNNNVRSNVITSNNVRSNIITNNNTHSSIIANNNTHNSIIANSNARSSVITNSNGRNGVITSNNRSGFITSDNTRSGFITSSSAHGGYITSNNARSSFITNNARNGVIPNNNARNSVVPSNNVRNSVIPSNNVRNGTISGNNVRNSVINNNVRNGVITSSNARNNVISNNNTRNGVITSSNARNSVISNNNAQFSNGVITNNGQFRNNVINKNNDQLSNSIMTNNNSQFSNSIVTNNNNQFSSFVTHNSSQASNSIISHNNNQVSNSTVTNISSQVNNSTATNNSNQANNSTATNNSNQANNSTATNNSNQVSNNTATNISSQASNSIANQINKNNNKIDSPEQPDGTTVISDHISSISPGVSEQSRNRGNEKGQGRARRARVRRQKGRSDIQSQATIADTEDVTVEEAGNENKRRKISEENDDGTTTGLAMNVDGNDEILPMESHDASNINTTTTPIAEPPSSTRTPARSKSKGSRSKRARKNSSTRKSGGKRGRPNTTPETTRTEDARGSDQDEQLEPTSDVPQSLVDTVPDVPEPEPKSTIALRKYLESLCLNEMILSRDRLLRLGTFILDYFVSQAWCRPFVNPEDESAVIYRSVITRLMDLTTVEHNLWAGEYDGAISKLYDDLAQIIYNAFKFHPEGSIIFNEANLMLECFVELTTRFSKPPHDLDELDATLAQVGAKLPHEEFSDVSGVTPNPESRIFIVPLYSFRQVSKSGSNVAKLPQAAAERLDPMSRPLFDIFEHRNLPLVRFQPTETHCNFARLYITAGAQNIKNCRDERNAILLIVKDVSYLRGENRLRCNVIIAKPFGELRELDTIGFPELQDARYWTRVAFLDRQILDLKVGPKFFDKYLRTPFKVSEYDRKMITLQQHDAFLAALNLRQEIFSFEGLSIWQRLVAEANKVKVPIESFESLGKPIQVDAEGFFKRVFHVPGDDKYVVQNFKEISEGTLETRIKEAVCCLKTKGVSNTGQIRSVYKDDDDDELVGLSMVRYNYTLKEYAFNTRSPITGEQKYRLIHDMVKGIKALHEAGFAHRDLSEVNMMVNNTTEKLSDGSTKPELVVIDFGKAEFINRDDVLAWSVGEVTNDKLEYLPCIKTVPDHGYKLYRSAATLPRTKNDHAVLQNPIDPCSEDIYAVGVLAWRIFSGQAPWGGILDTDLKNLREIVTDPIKIKFHIEKNVNGKKSRELLLKCITSTSLERSTAKELLDWLIQSKDELISEWATSGRVRIRKQL